MQVSFLIAASTSSSRARALRDAIRSTLHNGISHEVLLAEYNELTSTEDCSGADTTPRFSSRSAALNAAAHAANGELLCFLDDRIELTPGWFEPLLTTSQRSDHVALLASVLTERTTRNVRVAGILFSDTGELVPLSTALDELQTRGDFFRVPAASTACGVVRRDWFLRRGGFDESLESAFADFDLCLRAHEDGFAAAIAPHSVVHVAADVSVTPPLHWTNLSRLLARWGERPELLTREWSATQARERAFSAATSYLESLPHRLGFGSPALRRVHRRALSAHRHAATLLRRPVRVAVDLLRMQPGGANGGVKPFVFSFLEQLRREKPDTFQLSIFAQESLRREITPLLQAGDLHASPYGAGFAVQQRAVDSSWNVHSNLNSADASRRLGVEVLWSPFGDSPFLQPSLPSVSVLIDLLHRDVPDALPPEEVEFRHRSFQRVAATASYIQTISQDAAARLHAHYGVAPARCFHTYLPVQSRLPEPAADVPLPPGINTGAFFFYPANFWPHKNHETLLHAYRIYHDTTPTPWPLILTGAPDPRLPHLEAVRDQLDLAAHVSFLGHLPDAQFSALWAGAGALVFPSLYEGFGIPLLEAMRFGIPTLCSDAASLPEVGGDACLFVDAHDRTALANGLQRIATDDELRTRLRERARARLSHFCLSLEVGRFAHYLEAAARQRVA